MSIDQTSPLASIPAGATESAAPPPPPQEIGDATRALNGALTAAPPPRPQQTEQQAFLVAVKTLNDSKAWAIMDYLEGKDCDWQNDLVGDNGLQQLAGLTLDSPQWDQLANDRPDRAVPREERQKYIDAAKSANSPEQAAHRKALQDLGANPGLYNKEDWQVWIDASENKGDNFLIAALRPEQKAFLGAVSALNNHSAWALMDLLEGSGFDMHNDLVGDIGLGELAKLTPDSSEWDKLPGDKAVPDKAVRQAMIDAAKLILSPEQTTNRERLKQLGANADAYNPEDWQSWIAASDGLITKDEAKRAGVMFADYNFDNQMGGGEYDRGRLVDRPGGTDEVGIAYKFGVADQLDPDHIDGLVNEKEAVNIFTKTGELLYGDYNFDGVMDFGESLRADNSYKRGDAFDRADKEEYWVGYDSGFKFDGRLTRKQAEEYNRIGWVDPNGDGYMDRGEYDGSDPFTRADGLGQVDGLITQDEAIRGGVEVLGCSKRGIPVITSPLFSDPNHDGFMDRSEYENAKNSIPKDLAERGGLHFFDTNNDGYMTRDEWARGTLKESGMADVDVERYAPFLSKPGTWWVGDTFARMNESSHWVPVGPQTANDIWPLWQDVVAKQDLLAAKIKEGVSAGDALLWSIFSSTPADVDAEGGLPQDASTIATAEHLGDPQFLKDLSTAFYGNGSSLAECRDFALSNLRIRQEASSGQTSP